MLERLISSLPDHVQPVVFPAIHVKPNEMVSSRLLDAIDDCEGLIYLTAGESSRSFWVAFERDYALRVRKSVFAVQPDSLEVTVDHNEPLDLAAFPVYHRQDQTRIEAAFTFLREKRFFDLWLERDMPAGARWQEEMQDALADRLRRGYAVVFWSSAAASSLWVRAELEAAAASVPKFNDRVLFAQLDETPLPAFWRQFHEPALQFYEDSERSFNQRVDDLVVRLYWLIYRKTQHSGLH